MDTGPSEAPFPVMPVSSHVAREFSSKATRLAQEKKCPRLGKLCAAAAEASGDHVTEPQTFRTSADVTVAVRPSAPSEHMLDSHSGTICLGIQLATGSGGHM